MQNKIGLLLSRSWSQWGFKSSKITCFILYELLNFLQANLMWLCISMGHSLHERHGRFLWQQGQSEGSNPLCFSILHLLNCTTSCHVWSILLIICVIYFLHPHPPKKKRKKLPTTTTTKKCSVNLWINWLAARVEECEWASIVVCCAGTGMIHACSHWQH